MSVHCPDGHPSNSTDYCDVCGLPITAPGAGPGPGPAPVAPVTVRAAAVGEKQCPNCGSMSPPDALFCEDCGRDFTTGALPPPLPGVGGMLSLDPPAAAPAVPAPAVPAPAVPVPAAPAAAPTPPEPPAPAAAPPAWVAEVWVDPDWYATQESDDPCPSPGTPVVVRLDGRSLLVGRHSASRGITPQVDCGVDSGVSRRHAQLTTDGSRWWLEDLQSANGSYLGKPGGPLPTEPLEPGLRFEVESGDRIYLGAWTRVVLRRALPGE